MIFVSRQRICGRGLGLLEWASPFIGPFVCSFIQPSVQLSVCPLCTLWFPCISGQMIHGNVISNLVNTYLLVLPLPDWLLVALCCILSYSWKLIFRLVSVQCGQNADWIGLKFGRPTQYGQFPRPGQLLVMLHWISAVFWPLISLVQNQICQPNFSYQNW